jgi:hypothetical protein
MLPRAPASLQRRLVALLTVVALSATGCSRGADSTTAPGADAVPSDPASTESAVVAGEAAARLLTPDDLPGWFGERLDLAGVLPLFEQAIGTRSCGNALDLGGAAPSDQAYVLLSQSPVGPFLLQVVVTYEDESGVETAFGRFDRYITSCNDFTVETDGEAPPLRGRLERVEPPPAGDRIVAARSLVDDGPQQAMAGDLVVVRRDGALTVLVQVTRGVGEPAGLESITAAADAKLG